MRFPPVDLAGLGIIVLFLVSLGVSLASGGTNFLGTQVNFEPSVGEGGSALPDTSVDPSSPRWTEAEVDAFSSSVGVVQREAGASPEAYNYIQVTRTVQSVKVTYAACYQSNALRDVLAETAASAAYKRMELVPSLSSSTSSLPRLSSAEMLQQLSLVGTAVSSGGTVQRDNVSCVAGVTGPTCPCSEKFVGSIFEYGGHSGNLWEMLPYLPAPSLSVVKWSWWQMVEADVSKQAIFQHWGELEDYYQAHYDELCADLVHATPEAGKVGPPWCLSSGHREDLYLKYVQDKYAAWGYDEESGQTYDKQHVMASCGGLWMPWQYPFGCAIQTHEFRTEIWAGGTGYTGSESNKIGAVDYGNMIYYVDTDLLGRASESTLYLVVLGSIKQARESAAINTKSNADRLGSTWTATGWFGSSSAVPDEASNTATGKEYDAGVLAANCYTCISIHPLMNDRAVFHADIETGDGPSTYLRLPNFVGGSYVNMKYSFQLDQCDDACIQVLGDYVKELVNQGKLVDAALFLNSGLFGPDAPIIWRSACEASPTPGCTDLLHSGKDDWWVDVDGASAQPTTPERAIARWTYFYESNRLEEMYGRKYWTSLHGWPPPSESDTWTSSSANAPTPHELYEQAMAWYTRPCNYYGKAGMGLEYRRLMLLHDPIIAQRVRDGSLSMESLDHTDAELGGIVFGDSKCPVKYATGKAPDILQQLLSLFGVTSDKYTDPYTGQTYTLLSWSVREPTFVLVEGGGVLGIATVYLSDLWLYAVFLMGVPFLLVGLVVRVIRWRRRKRF